MFQGRRPSSLCGAAILISTKIHDVKCLKENIRKTVYVCKEDWTSLKDKYKKGLLLFLIVKFYGKTSRIV